MARSTIAAVSSPAGRVPSASPEPDPSPASRDAQNASATVRRGSAAPAASPAAPAPSTRPPGGPTPRRAVTSSLASRSAAASSRRSAPRASADLGPERLHRGRLAGQRAQHVECVDVARALPDRVQRRLAVEPRQPALLDVAVAAEALQRLADHRRGALADPVLADRDGQPAEVPLVGVDRVRQPQSRARWPPRPRPRGRPARCASAACRPAARRTRCGAPRGGSPARRPRASARSSPRTQSSRVADTISMIVRTPRPSSPSRRAQVPSSSTSADAFDRLPSLSFSRCSRNVLRVPSGSTRGTTKQVSPPGAWASTRNTSHIGAEQNHLCPVSTYSPSAAERLGPGRVRPDVGAALLLGHAHARPAARTWSAASRNPASYDVASAPARTRAASAGSARKAGTAA